MNRNKCYIFIFIIGTQFLLSACVKNTPALNCPIPTKQSSIQYEAKGLASWYGAGFHKKRTSSGERFNMNDLTAAHKTLPLSTYAQVTNLNNGEQVIVRINDRGPFVRDRVIDLSYAAAKKLGMIGHGVAPVSIKAIC